MAESILFKRGKYSTIAALSSKASNAIYFGAPDDDNHIGALWVGDKVIANTTKIADVQWDSLKKDEGEALSLSMEESTIAPETWSAWTGTPPDSDKYTYYIKVGEEYKKVLSTDSEAGYQSVESLTKNAPTAVLYKNAKGSYLYIGNPTNTGTITYTRITISSGTTVESLSSEISALANRISVLETKVGDIDSSIGEINSSINTIKTEQSTQNTSINTLEVGLTSLTELENIQNSSILELTTSVGEAGDSTNPSTGLYKVIDDAKESAISASKIELSTSSDTENALVYTLTQNGQDFTINVPKDQFLDSVEYVTDANKATIDADDTTTTTPYLKFTWKIGEGTKSKSVTRISVSELIDTYTSGDDYVKVGNDRKITIDLDAIKTALNIPTTKVVAATDSTINVTSTVSGNETTYIVDLLWEEITTQA